MATTSAQSPLANEWNVAKVVVFLQEVLGARLVALIAGEQSTEPVRAWASGVSEPRAAARQRLYDTYAVADLLLQEESPQTARAWFVGMNPLLNAEDPASALARGDTATVLLDAKALLAGAGA